MSTGSTSARRAAKGRAARSETGFEALNRQIVDCERCARLREYCCEIGRQRRAAYREWDYWSRPVPNFGDPRARLLIVGLAPAAHGGNRTGRVFTGDRSGEWLFRALYKAGFANQPNATHAGDGLELTDCAITAACHCAPPDNKPTPAELANCGQWFSETFDLLPARVILALGQIGWRAVVAETRRRGWYEGPMPRFGHRTVVPLAGKRNLLGSYHPSQQNTFTGKLTEPMFDAVFRAARQLLDAKI